MNVFIVLLRGINIGGHNVVRMAALRDALTAAGFANVATYIQSGNVVLASDGQAAEVAALVDQAFTSAFGFSSRPTVRSLEDWHRVIDENPFVTESGQHKSVSAILLDDQPPPDAVESLRALATTEQLVLKDGVLYMHAPDGFGRSKVAANLDRMLKVPLTGRNWRTVMTLMEMANEAAKKT
jgi:uncharacterized protein (DUF1697 family)